MNKETDHEAFLKELGGVLFGKATRMVVGMFLSHHVGEQVTFAQLREECKQHEWPCPPAFKPDISSFQRLGCVSRLGPTHFSYHEYVVNDSPIWPAFRQLAIADETWHRPPPPQRVNLIHHLGEMAAMLDRLKGAT